MQSTENIKNTSREIKKRKFQKCIKNVCTIKAVKRRLPILDWLPKYSLIFLIQDVIAGLTVALTAIPQGIAYAVVANLPPEYGLYGSLTAGFVYTIFGSCKHITVGPTAVLATLVAKYAAGYSLDLVILGSFLCGIFVLIMGICNLGFIVEFISMPVINGFTTAAAVQIAAQQLKSLLALEGSSGYKFIDAAYNFVINIKTIQLWDSMLGIVTIIVLVLLKKLGEGCSRTDGVYKQIRWFISLARNAIVVFIGIIIAYIAKVYTESEPIVLIGDIGNGLPNFKLPPFTITVDDDSYNFTDILKALGLSSVILPLVAVLESVAIAKAFAESGRVDATQEMIALGMCNIIGSFFSSMPVTGSFTRSTLNYASGVQTPFGCVIVGLIIIVALTLLTSTFYYIPQASLAGLIITAMFYMVDYKVLGRFWRNSKREFSLFLTTMMVCLVAGIEYGIISGVILEAAVLLFTTSRPKLNVTEIKNDKIDLLVVPLNENVAYCSAEHLRRQIMKAVLKSDSEFVVIDGTSINKLDITVAVNLMAAAKDLNKMKRQIVLVNFNTDLKNIFIDIYPAVSGSFATVSNLDELVKSLCRDV